MNDTFVARLEATLGRPLGPKRLGRKPVTVHGFSDEKAQQNGVLLNAGAILDPHFSRPGGKTVAIRPVFWGFTPVNGYENPNQRRNRYGVPGIARMFLN